LAQQLVASGELTLGNIRPAGHRADTPRLRGNQAMVVPASVPSDRDGLPSHKVVADILEVVDGFAPDLVHVWGTEAYWGLLTARGYIRTPALLEMQGLKGAIAKKLFGWADLEGTTRMHRFQGNCQVSQHCSATHTDLKNGVYSNEKS